MFKKGLVTVIILLFIGISIIPKTTAYSNTKPLDVNENIINNTNGLPDIIIVGVGTELRMTDQGEFYFVIGCFVKNIGDAATGSYWSIMLDVDFYEARIFSPDNYYGHYWGGGGSSAPFEPGESRFIGFYDTFEKPFPCFFLSFEFQLTCKFEEENIDNNYFEKTYFRLFLPWLIPLPILF